jgi:hypothetical protein
MSFLWLPLDEAIRDGLVAEISTHCSKHFGCKRSWWNPKECWPAAWLRWCLGVLKIGRNPFTPSDLSESMDKGGFNVKVIREGP